MNYIIETTVVIGFFVILFLFVNPCAAQMTCGNTIISVGDNIEKVYMKCGKPTMTSKDMDGGRNGKGPNTYYYDMGKDQYIKKLFVQGGRIERIEWLDKGK